MSASSLPVSDADRTATVYRTAGELLFRCSGYWLDVQERKDHGWRIHYALDTDVLVSYLDPADNGHYGQLFENTEDLPKVLVRMMTEFIMRSLRSGVPEGTEDLGKLLIISPHDEELHGQFLRVREEMAEWVRRAEKEGEAVLKDIRQGFKDDKALVELLIAEATALMQVFERSGPFEKVNRFSRIGQSRITNVQRFQESNTGFAFPHPPEDASHPEFRSYVRSFDQWQERLSEARGSSQKSDWAVTNDAKVLNRLAWINAQIAPQKRRLVLVTGSANIFAAARQPPRSREPSVGALLVEGDFERRYLRHPQAFLGDWDFFATENRPNHENSTELRVFNWLNLLFPSHIDMQAPGGIHRREELARELREASKEEWSRRARELREVAARKAGSEKPESYIESVIQGWDRQVRTVAVETEMLEAVKAPPKTKSAEKLLAMLRAQTGDDLTTLLHDLATTADTSRAHLHFSTAILGELVEHNTHPFIRGVPALRFEEEYRSIQDTCNELQDAMFKNELRVDLGKLYSEFASLDPAQYHALVVHALLFAIRGHWHGARTLCHSALAVVDSILPGNRAKRTGREAAYLLAVAERRLARHEKHLQSWRRYIDMAQERETPGQPRDPRFDSECLAGEVALLALRRRPNGGSGIQFRESLMREVLSKGKTILANLEREKLSQVRAWVTRQVFSNVIGLGLLVELDKPGSTMRWQEEFNALVLRFRELHLAPDARGKFRDVYSDVIYWAAQAVYAKDGGHRRDAILPLSEVKVENFPLDRDRVAAYVKVGLRAAAGSRP